MRMRTATLALITVGLATIAGGACNDKAASVHGNDKAASVHGKEGEWFTAKYESDGKPSEARILVEASIAEKTESGTVVVVFWKAENNDKDAATFSWDNKNIIDSEGRKFEPKLGSGTGRLQPTEISELQFTEYKLPPAISTQGLGWGLVWDGTPVYQIDISAAPPPTCAEMATETVTRQAMGEDVENILLKSCKLAKFVPRQRYCLAKFDSPNAQGCCPGDEKCF